MSSVNRRRGKDHQRKIAKIMKGMNVGTLGGIDVLSDKFAIECKSRVKFVGLKWYEQAEKNNVYNKVTVVVVHLKGKKYLDDLVLIKLKDFLKLIK
mgnify:CR=1 FL=1